jgi:hypothetical protein
MMNDASSSADAPPAPQPSRRFSWNKAAVIVLIVLAVGIGLNWWHPLLLAPPYLGATRPLYAACGLVWLPVLLVCLLARPTGRRAIPIYLLIVGLVLFCVTFSVSGAAFPAGAFGLSLQCEVVSETPERVRYECVADRMFMTDTYILEGPTGLPIVWLVSQSSVSY